MKTKRETRIYPMCCTSAYCGGGGDDCLTCQFKGELDSFNEWVERKQAICPDEIWCPLFYEATI